MHPKNISIEEYTYSLPDERIANLPLGKRDESKLLVYDKGLIREDVYENVANLLPTNSLLVFNQTKVIQARILFQKSSGGVIEIFCLEPYEAINDYSIVMQMTGSVKWKCMIGGASKWKEGALEKQMEFNDTKLILYAKLLQKLTDAYVVEFSWAPSDLSFASIIELAGNIPLPPYIKRKPDEDDKERYQTIYAKDKGSVAAPTAGLHFTENIFGALKQKGVTVDYVTLHVGAGTFKPVKASKMENHEMHAEWIDVSANTIKGILDNLSNSITAVGTTSLRTIESLYWIGVKTILDPNLAKEGLLIDQWDVYEDNMTDPGYTAYQSLKSLLEWMKNNNQERLISSTRILIAPGYQFRIAKALITNFHQPKSTLLLLVAAAIGEDWKKVYQYALENDFRFLSYGDGSLLFFNK